MEPVGLASGLITLITFGIKSSSSLYQTIKDFNSHQRNVRQLKGEIEALNLVLASLHQAVLDSDADFTPLKLPLLRCGNACNDFNIVIMKATEHSDGPKTSFRDWARLRYMGDDITGFQNILAGYKATISIALCDANLRASTVTAKALNEYHDMIKNTMSDLEDHLQDVNSKLQALVLSAATPNQNDAERDEMQNERDSIQQCLDICAKVSSHIDEVRSGTFQDTTTGASEHHNNVITVSTAASARLATADVLGHCKDRLATTSSQLNRHLTDVCGRLDALNHRQPTSQDSTERRKLQEEIESIKQSIAICATASEKASSDRINIYESVSMAEDGHQLVVSTVGDLINARNISAGARSAQWLGQMSDLSLQQISRDRSHIAVKQSMEQQAEDGPQFEGRYGRGRNL